MLLKQELIENSYYKVNNGYLYGSIVKILSICHKTHTIVFKLEKSSLPKNSTMKSNGHGLWGFWNAPSLEELPQYKKVRQTSKEINEWLK
jgi:hypothetical protein